MKPEVAKIIAGAEIIPRLAPSDGPEDGDPIPGHIVGSRILGFGTISRGELAGGYSCVANAAIVIDYIPEGTRAPRRVAFGASEFGTWIAYEDVLREPRTLYPSRGDQL
jgi:hypothetical protein